MKILLLAAKNHSKAIAHGLLDYHHAVDASTDIVDAYDRFTAALETAEPYQIVVINQKMNPNVHQAQRVIGPACDQIAYTETGIHLFHAMRVITKDQRKKPHFILTSSQDADALLDQFRGLKTDIANGDLSIAGFGAFAIATEIDRFRARPKR